ncbi:MAG TPA: S9 family peptidase [Bryobacteraceae bacterium]|nr:S9 family peptidase [Bryobacteraceae bacterium]
MGSRTFIIALFAASFGLLPAADRKPVTIDALMAVKPSLAGHATGSVTWSPDGGRFVANNDGSLSVYNVTSGGETKLLDLKDLEDAAVKPPKAETFDWTNRNVAETPVQWFKDGKRLLVSAGGDLFVVDSGKGSWSALTQTSNAETDPKLSPDNKFVSFLIDSDLYALEISSKHVTRLTKDGSSTLLNARPDWVYPEELDVSTAYWWSPDSRSIAYMQFDVSHEPIFPQVSLLTSRGLLEPQRYPKPGDPNADVRLGVVPIEGGATKWMELGDPRDALLARVVWSPSGREIFAERLNRIQNHLSLLSADPGTGAAKIVLTEDDPYWINVKGAPKFIDNGARFLWTSERTGYRHLYLYSSAGQLEKQLTSGEWEVDEITAVDQKRGIVYFTSSEASPIERQLYAVGFDGSGKRRLSRETGTHAVSFSPDCADYLDDYSAGNQAPRTIVMKADGSVRRIYRAPDTSLADEYDILPREMVTVKTHDGVTLYGRLTKPAGYRDGLRYPTVVMVYGGPGVQVIHDSWSGLGWDQVLARQGFAVWQMDNRGSMGRGHGFESVIFRNTGVRELADQREGIEYLISRGIADPKRIGMYGWSYGGYMTLFTATNAPGLLKAAIAGAPVTNWHNYDTIYTERYMGLPDQNPDGYQKTSPQTSAGKLEGTKLLLLHNVEDDNVHFQNTVQMANALELAGKKFYMVVYPQKSHGVEGPPRKQLLDETTAFFEENLK